MNGLNSDRLVVIVGGSGFVGRYVVQELVRTGVRLRIVSRTPERAVFLKPLGALGQIQIVGGDVRNPGSIDAAFDKASAGINLVGILDERGGQSFDAIQATGAGKVAKAAADANVEAFVHVSAIGADGAAAAGYARSKAVGETAVRAALPTATIVRPSVVFGAEDQFINRFAALAQRLPMIPVIAGDTRFQPVFVVDLARAIVAALDDPARHGGMTYELGGPRIYSFREIIGWIVQEVRSTRPMVEVPQFVARLMARAGDFIPGAPMTSDQWLMLQSDNVAKGDGLAALGVDPTPLEAVAPGYLGRYRTGGRFHHDAELAR